MANPHPLPQLKLRAVCDRLFLVYASIPNPIAHSNLLAYDLRSAVDDKSIGAIGQVFHQQRRAWRVFRRPDLGHFATSAEAITALASAPPEPATPRCTHCNQRLSQPEGFLTHDGTRDPRCSLYATKDPAT